VFRQLDRRIKGSNQTVFHDSRYSQRLSVLPAKVGLDR
jgi:hypothetical protein